MPTDFQRKPVEGLSSGFSPGLWVVATPIGNLSDISERARLALGLADRVLCEDTRRTAQLIQALGIQRPDGGRVELERIDAHASAGRLERAMEWLEAGENLAIVTDAGTPAISDPGAHLVRMAHERGVRVTPIPGPSAVTAILSASGFGETAFCFRGFFPRKETDRLREVETAFEISAISGTRVHVWFESPQRIVESLEGLLKGLSGNALQTRVCAAKELSKAFEKIFTGTAEEVLTCVREHVSREGEKGEWSLAILLPERESAEAREGNSSDWVKALQCMLEDQGENPPISASDAARRVSQYFGTPKKQAYEKALRISGKKA